METIPFREGNLIFKTSPDVVNGFAMDEETAVWVPTEPGIENRFLLFDLNRNSFAVASWQSSYVRRTFASTHWRQATIMN